jgi:hypothetical protein
MVGQRIFDNYKFLKKIAHCKSPNRRLQYLKNASRDELLSLVEVATNILSPRYNNLNRRHRSKLIPHADQIRRLSRIRSEKGARYFTQQTGNGIVLSSLLIPIIAEVGRALLSS